MSPRTPALKRDLDFLLSSQQKALTRPANTDDANPVHAIELSRLEPGRYQPRRHIDTDSLKDLANSIAEHGVLQPIIARAIDDKRFEIIAGERRWRAASQVGLTTVPTLIRDIDDRTAIALALIENMQRENLSPLEEAEGLARLIDEFDLSHQQVASAVGKSRSMVSNLLRLLQLAPAVKIMLAEGKLEMGHARALLSLAPAQQESLAELIAHYGLSVRETERRVRLLLQDPQLKPTKMAPPAELANFADLLAKKLQTKVAVKTGTKPDHGQLVISYNSKKALQHIITSLELE